MAIKTKYYGLEHFSGGDYYSAAADKRRFTTIDSQLGLLSDIIGPGVIEGWEIRTIDNSGPVTLSVSAGIGMIGRTVYQSFGEMGFSVALNQTKYIYMKKKTDKSGGFSGSSNIDSAIASDTTPPTPPANLSVVTELVAYNQLGFDWDANTEADFSHYVVTRFGDTEYGVDDVITITTDTLFLDQRLEQNTPYTYQVVSVDLSGNESISSGITIYTSIDTREPLPPLFLQVYAGNESAQVIWDNSPSDYVEFYEVQVQLLDIDYNSDGPPVILPLIDANSEVGFGSTYQFVNNLINNSYYDISVRSLSTGGEYSQDIYKQIKPLFNNDAGEVGDIVAKFPESNFPNTPMVTELSWSYTTDEYFLLADQFLITFLENGTRESEPISILSTDSNKITSCLDPETGKICFSTTINYIPYLDSGVVNYEAIKEYTPYLIRIQTYIQDDEVLSNGAFLRVERTPSYQLLTAVSDPAIERNSSDNSIIAKWVNPSTLFFNNCKITASIVDLTTINSDIVVVEDLDVGRATSYTLPGILFEPDQRYDFTITPVDIFGRDGEAVEISNQFLGEEESPIPDAPADTSIVSKDGLIVLSWGEDTTTEIISYKIYKSDASKIYYRASDFTLIASVDKKTNTFNDFDIINGDRYAYMVTSVNIFGNESLNPVDNNYVSTSLLRGFPSQSGTLIPPENLVATANGQDVDLTWDFTSGAFDGYEVYRSIGSKYDFEVIDNVFASATSYTDIGALLKDGEEYYYFLRKYKNETIIFVSDSSVAPSESVILGRVTVSSYGSDPVIDTSIVTILKDLETPLGEITQTSINAHHHNIDDLGQDKRIELRSNSIASDWETVDFQLYSTVIDISGAENYIVKVFAEVNEAYYTDSNGFQNYASIKQAQDGSPPILYSINGEDGTITFDTPLYTTCEEPENPDPLDPTNVCPVTPYSSEPSISIELLGISEVEGYLTDEQIRGLNATQVTSGVLDPRQMPIVRHDGRVSEKLLPLSLPTKSYDNFVYSLSDIYTDDSRNRMGSAVTFYDIIDIIGEGVEEEDILAATSSGVWFSSDFGNNWSQKETFPEAVQRVFQGSDRRTYAVTNYGVFLSDGVDLGSWIEMSGLSGVKVIRDIAEDSTGNVYITTDVGVFRLNKDKPYIEDTWEQLSIFGVKSSEAYGIIYVPEEDKILTSNELGILESTNEGASWTFVSELDTTTKVIRFERRGNYIFALTNDKVYRKEVGVVGFDEVASLRGVKISRQIVIYLDRIYIATDDGIKISSPGNIYTETEIEFQSVWSNINEKGVNTIITSLNILANSLFIGRDKKIYLFKGEDLWLQYEHQSSIVPTIYVNLEEQKLGYYYNNGGEFQNISFYEQVEVEDTVTISNRYDIYIAENGGWGEQKYDAKVKLWKNRLFYAESTEDISIDQNAFVQFEFPVYNDSNANKETALEYQTLMQDDLDILTGLILPEDDDLRELITKTNKDYQHFISQLYPSARVVSTTDANGGVSTEPLVFPEINVELVNKQPIVTITGDISYNEISVNGIYNVTNGQFVFENDFEKGDTFEIDIIGTTVKNAGDFTHRELEDELELVNSGLTSVLSQVSQVNNIKLGIFTETQWPGERENCSPPLQAEYIIPDDSNWYDTLNSTVNYIEEITEDEVTFAILYPTSVFYVAEIDSIIVGGVGGAITIDVSTLGINEVKTLGISSETVKKIDRWGDILYLLTDKKIYRSDDFGAIWGEVSRSGLPNDLGSIGFVQNNLVIGAEDGIYFRSSESSDWERVLVSENMVNTLSTPDILFAVVDNKIYSSANGYTYVDLEITPVGNISQLVKHLSTIYVSTDTGLYNDTGTFYGENPTLTQLVFEEKEDVGVNDLNSDQINLMVGLADGSYYQLNTEGAVLNEFSDLRSIHKILLVDGEVYLFGFDQMKATGVDHPIRLTTGVPL